MALTKLPPVLVAAMLLTTAFAAVPVAAAGESVAVTTQFADEVTDDSATLHGNLTALENASEATVWFEYWADGDAANATNTTMETVSGVGPFHGAPDGLESNTTYVFVAHAETANASAVGAEKTFTTAPAEHVAVATGDADDVTNVSATLDGDLTALEGAENATVWFEYWADGDRSESRTTPELVLDEPGAFSASVDGLEPGTEYDFVAHARTEHDAAVGEVVAFETESDARPLGVETGAATAVERHEATLEGELTGLDGHDTGTVWFEYWPAGRPDDSSSTNGQTLDGPGAFDETVDGLENDTTYVYVAHARVGGETATGGEVEFTTDDDSDDPARDGDGSFGQWLSSWISNHLPHDGDKPFGQLVSDLVHQQNPGSDKRSGASNAGGNGNGPPDHAGGDDEDDEDDES